MSGDSPDFVKWREEFVSEERGSRVVHYYLEDASGESHLAVVGTERSLRHMLYVVSEEFYQRYWSDKSSVSLLKWRSRREVMDWLSSFLPANACNQKFPNFAVAETLGAEKEVNRYTESGGYRCKHMDKCHMSNITWSGVSWTCGKQLRHYQAFYCNGTKIATHSFVLVLSEEETRYLAYLEDMYEDKKGLKKVKVRWFHQNQEFSCTIPAPTPHPCEVFITPYSQVISAECVDDIASVLIPEHYEKCSALLPSSAGIWLCFRQFSKNKFKLFDLRTLRGYFNQTVLSSLDLCTESEFFSKGEEISGCNVIAKQGGPKRIRFIKGHHTRFLSDRLTTKRSGYSGHITSLRPYNRLRYDLPVRRNLQVKFVSPCNWLIPLFKVGEKIELLCQDSGIRGCWFKCTILQFSYERLKVQYDDVQNVDGCGNLEEWIPVHKPAAADRLGMRYEDRLTIRPCPTCTSLLDNVAIQNGMAVDARWSDGWWEGVVVGADSCRHDNLHVYLPGEDILLTCELKNLRISKDWVGNRWVDIKAKPDVLSVISLISPTIKLTACSIFSRATDSGCSAMSDQEIIASHVDSSQENQLVQASLIDRTSLAQEAS